MSSESDEENKVTADDIISSVLQTKSKLGGQLLNTNYRRSKVIARENITDSSVGQQKSTLKDFRLSEYTPVGKTSSASSKNSFYLSGRTPSTQVVNNPQTVFHSKLTRSVSTPEINDKFMKEPMSYTKSKAHRQVIFTSRRNGPELNKVNQDDLLKLLNEDDDDDSNYFTKVSEKSSSSSSLNTIIKPKNNTDYMKLQRNTYERNNDNKENIDQTNTLLSAKLPAMPLTSSSKKINPSHSTKCKETIHYKDTQEKINFTEKENRSTTQSNTTSASLSLNIGNSDLITVNNLNYLIMGKLGKGGSSVVYEVLDMQSKQRKAIKVVTLDDQDEATRISYNNEIKILLRLQYSSRIIKLFDHEEGQSNLKLVMEAGSVDLSSMIMTARQKKGQPIPAFTVKHYWQEMLLAVQVIHNEGIIHSDLKPANFLQANGMLKLIDFGIASSVQQDMTSVFKDSQAGTYNFMSPESLNDISSGPIFSSKVLDNPTIKINVKSDVWSLGCILYNLVYGKTPFQHLQNPLQKLAAISNPKTKIDFPPIKDENLLDVLRKCLQFDAYKRPSIKELLSHPYLEDSHLVKEHEGSRAHPPNPPYYKKG